MVTCQANFLFKSLGNTRLFLNEMLSGPYNAASMKSESLLGYCAM
jgi:hypothetical protein